MPFPSSEPENPEAGLLLAFCRRDRPAQLTAERFALLRDDQLRTRFTELAARHRVSGLVLAQADASGHLHLLGDRLSDEWQTHLRQLRRRAAGLEIERDHLFHALDRVAAGALVLKGGALVGSVYENPVERDMADLDFLVAERRLKPATRAMQAAGYRMLDIPNVVWIYRRHHFHFAMVKAEALRAELHWGLERPVRPAVLDAKRFLSDARMRPDGIRIPAMEHTLLHLVLQSCHEGYSRLSRFVDIDRIVAAEPEFDWEHLVELARESVLAEATATALQIAGRLLDTPVPHRVMLALRPGSFCRSHVAMFRPLHAMFEPQRAAGSDCVLRFWILDNISNRLAYFAAELAPAVTFPPTLTSPTLSQRILRLAKLCWVQIALYGRSAAALCSARGRAQMRFWSKNASNSDRR